MHGTLEDMYIDTNLSGLTQEKAKEHLVLYGKNALPEKESNTMVRLFFSQFLSPFIYVLLAVAAISLITKNITDFIVILLVLLVNAIVGTFQEHRANNAIKALKKLTHIKTKVIRGGLLLEIRTDEVTVEDVVYLESGDIIPADGELLESHQISVNESQITGESIPITKEKKGMMYKSSIVVSGSGFMLVKKVGESTFIGAIAKDIAKNINKQSELEKKIARFSVRLILLLLATIGVFIAFSVSKGLHLIESLKTSVALGVAVVPEGLPVVLTVVLSLGVLHISRAKALLRNLHSGSTLASVSYICTDKTGTLTYGNLSVKNVIQLDQSLSKEQFDEYMYHSIDIKTINGKKVGDILELTLEEYLKGEFFYKEIKEAPFTSETKYNAKEFEVEGKYIQIFKGAPESIGISEETILPFVKDGFRVIALGYKTSTEQEEFVAREIKPLGIVVFEDKIREQAKDSIAKCKHAGISVLMITGDNILTAKHVAKEVGIVTSERDLLITGKQLEELTDAELKEKIHSIKVIARANPLHKERIVGILQSKGEVVAMTGDGVNDAPALSLANIGISMGKSGTEVAKEASDLILMEDDFSDIVLAAFEARTISENIRKTLVFLMTSAFSLVVALLGSVFLSIPLPFLAVQILWLNFVTSGLLDVAIATEEGEEVYKKYNYKRYIGRLLSNYDIAKIVVIGLYIGVLTLVFFYAMYQSTTLEMARTGTMLLVSVFIWWNAINVRKNYDIVFSFNPLGNMYLVGAIVFEVVVLFGSIYLDIGNAFLGTVEIPGDLVLLLMGTAFSVVFVDAAFKGFAKGYKVLAKRFF